MKKIIIIILPVVFLFSTCALEIANVIGPGGGWVFFDKKNYDGGWRYIECAPIDIGELEDSGTVSRQKAEDLCISFSGGGWISNPWQLPDDDQLRKMLECFSYGLTRFSSGRYYISESVKVFHKNFKDKANGEVEIITENPGHIKVRPIRKF